MDPKDNKNPLKPIQRIKNTDYDEEKDTNKKAKIEMNNKTKIFKSNEDTEMISKKGKLKLENLKSRKRLSKEKGNNETDKANKKLKIDFEHDDVDDLNKNGKDSKFQVHNKNNSISDDKKSTDSKYESGKSRNIVILTLILHKHCIFQVTQGIHFTST